VRPRPNRSTRVVGLGREGRASFAVAGCHRVGSRRWLILSRAGSGPARGARRPAAAGRPTALGYWCPDRLLAPAGPGREAGTREHGRRSDPRPSRSPGSAPSGGRVHVQGPVGPPTPQCSVPRPRIDRPPVENARRCPWDRLPCSPSGRQGQLVRPASSGDCDARGEGRSQLWDHH